MLFASVILGESIKYKKNESSEKMKYKKTIFFADSIDTLFLYAFLILLPITYAFQVVIGLPEVGVTPYAFLLLSFIVFCSSKHNHADIFRLTRSPRDFLFLGFCFLLVHHGISVGEAFVVGDFQLAVRGLLLFTVPLLLFWLVQNVNAWGLRTILVIVAILGAMTSAEMFYENFSVRVLQSPTIFQLLNRDYVFARNGYELTQLFGIKYRPPGLLEHLHAVTYFAAFSSLASGILFCLSGRWYWLFGMCLSATALLMHGVRLPLMAAGLAFTALVVVFYCREKDKNIRKRGKWVVLSLFLLASIQLFIDPLGTSREYYWPAFLRGDFQIPDMSTTQYLVQESHRVIENSEWGKLLSGRQADYFIAFFGHGIVGSLKGVDGVSDDLFLLSILSQYGLVGTLIFLGIWVTAIYYALLLLLRASIDELEGAALYFAIGLLLMLVIGMLHSGVLQRKAIYPYFPIAIGIVWRYSLSAKISIQNESTPKRTLSK